MAEPIREKQFNVGQAPKVAVEAEAFDDSGVRLAQSLQGLVSDVGQFANQISGMYADGKQRELREMERQQRQAQQRAKAQKEINEELAYDEIAQAVKEDPTFLSKHDILPSGWTDEKWLAYNTLKGQSDAANFSSELDVGKEAYIKAVAADPNRSFQQAELDTVYQNIFDKKLRMSNGSGAWMQSFLIPATKTLNSRATADRTDRANRQRQQFERDAENSILASIADFDFSSITPELQQQANDYFIYNEGEEASPNDILQYGRATAIFDAYQNNRTLRKDLGLEPDKESMVKIFKQLASGNEDLTEVMEILLDMEMPGTNLTIGESGQREKLFEILEDSREERTAGQQTLLHKKVSKTVANYTQETNNYLKKIGDLEDMSSFMDFTNDLKKQNRTLREFSIEVDDTDPETQSRLSSMINKTIDFNNKLLKESRGIYFAEKSDASKMEEIYIGRMLGTISDDQLFQYREFLSLEDFNDFYFLEDEMERANTSVVKGFLNILGVDPGGMSFKEIIESRFFKPDSPEAIALNKFTTLIASEGNQRLLKYYNEYESTGMTLQQKLYNEPTTKGYIEEVEKARAKANEKLATAQRVYRDEPEDFIKNFPDEQHIMVFNSLSETEEQEKFIALLQQSGRVKSYINKFKSAMQNGYEVK